jgi:ATP-binding cassette subfamily C (CFTR/MRP) protein 1
MQTSSGKEHAAAVVCVQVQDVMLAIHTLWGAPVLIVIIVGLLYQQLGWATFVGLIVVAVYSPISSESVC